MTRKNHVFILLCFIVIPLTGYGQLGGQHAFEFLNVPSNTRTAALGGTNITSGMGDLGMVSSNPALLTDTSNNHLTVHWLNYFADISESSLTYARSFENAGTWAFNLSFFNYGEIERFDDLGFVSGTFNASEYTFSLSHSRKFGVFRAGTTVRLAVSDIASFQATALLIDVGGIFQHPEKELTIGMMIRNLGALLSDYTDENASKLPLDIQLGLTYKPEFMPLRFSVTARNLNRTDAVYFDPTGSSLTGQEEAPGFGEEVFRRLVIGTEIILSDHFQLRAGYNHLLRQELKLENVSGGAGFSFGLMFKIKRFEFSYARALYHTAGGSNTLQLTMDLGGIIKKKN